MLIWIRFVCFYLYAMLKLILIMFRFELLILNWKSNLILMLMCTSYFCMSMLGSIWISTFILICISLFDFDSDWGFGI